MKSMFRAACALLLLMLAAPAALAQSTGAQVGEGYGSVITTSTSWADLVVTYSGMVSTPAFVHNIGTAKVVVFFTASGSAPTAGGIVLKPGDTLTGNAAHVWVRSIDATGAVTVGKLAGALATDSSGNAGVVARGAGAIATNQVSIGTSSTLLVAARPGRAKVIASVGAANACAFGNTGVTTTTGFALQPVAGASVTLETSAAIYAACSAATTVSFAEIY